MFIFKKETPIEFNTGKCTQLKDSYMYSIKNMTAESVEGWHHHLNQLCDRTGFREYQKEIFKIWKEYRENLITPHGLTLEDLSSSPSSQLFNHIIVNTKETLCVVL